MIPIDDLPANGMAACGGGCALSSAVNHRRAEDGTFREKKYNMMSGNAVLSAQAATAQ
jgi:hypothetical protein